jgi:hypothetical protein
MHILSWNVFRGYRRWKMGAVNKIL